MRRLTVLTVLVLAMVALPAVASAQTMSVKADQPPGIEMQIESLMMQMMDHMEETDMSQQQMQMMMADMEMMEEELPPGVHLQLLKLMLKMDMQDMMALHQAIQQQGLLEQEPGAIMKFAAQLAR